MKKVLASALLLALAGCATPTVFRDPATGQVAQCNATTPGIFPIIAQHEINNCSQSYAKMGWQQQ